MSVRVLVSSESIEVLSSELVYTQARLAHDPHAEDLAPAVGKLIARADAVEAEQRAAHRAELHAQAGVDAADDHLDDAVDAFAKDALHSSGQDRTHPTFARYFARAPGEVLRLGLESEIALVDGWPTSLATEEDKSLRGHAKSIGGAVASGKDALGARRTAQGARADHRVRKIERLFEDVNAARQSLYGVLIQRAEKAHLPRGWADRFFRHAVKAPKGRAAAADPGAPVAAAAGAPATA